MTLRHPITPCLWFDGESEQAAKFYVSVFPKSRMGAVTYYGDAGKEIHGRPAGSVLTVQFTLNGQPFTAVNGGPHFRFNEAISLQVICETQKEIDYYWDTLSKGGDKKAQQCGWLKDKFGLSWQVAPRLLHDLLRDPARADRVMAAMLKQMKFDLATLRKVAKVS